MKSNVIRSFCCSVSGIHGEVIVEGNTRGLNGHLQDTVNVNLNAISFIVYLTLY